MTTRYIVFYHIIGSHQRKPFPNERAGHINGIRPGVSPPTFYETWKWGVLTCRKLVLWIASIPQSEINRPWPLPLELGRGSFKKMSRSHPPRLFTSNPGSTLSNPTPLGLQMYEIYLLHLAGEA